MAIPKVTIIDGNNEIELSTREDNVKAFMVKGEPGEDAVSPTITSERDGKVTTLTIVDVNGTQEADINDGFDPIVDVSKENRVTTLTITDFYGTETVEIPDGIDLTGGVPTNGVIGFDSNEIIYTCDGTETGDYYLTYENVDYYFTMPTVEDGDILTFNTDDLELSLDGTTIATSSSGTGTKLTFNIYIPNGYEISDEPFPSNGEGGGIIALKTITTAPATFSKGDKYYNSTDDLIYTATSSSSWNAGETPKATSLYLNEDDNELYRYYNNTMNKLESGGGGSLPVGAVLEFPTTDSTKLPTGFMFCDGSPISRTDYADLFAIIGTYFGSGDGSTTFNLPTKEGLVSVGIKSSDTDFNTIGKTGGSKTHSHTLENAQAALAMVSSAIHVRIAQAAESVQFSRQVSINSSTSSAETTLTTALVGSTDDGSSLQPYTVTNFIIKVSQTTPIQAEVVDGYSTSQTDAYSCDYINKCNTYSTNEVNTGKKWIDGKDIYSKVLISTYTASGSSAAFTQNLDINSPVDTMISYDGTYYELGGGLVNHINKLGTMTISGVNYQSTIYYHKGANVIQVGLSGKSSAQSVQFVVTVEYTKTTN